MDVPSKRNLVLLFLAGFTLSLLEPVILLAMGRDIASALWPMANRALDVTYFLRDWRTEVFALFLVILPFIIIKANKVM